MSFFKTLSEKLGFIADESDDDRNDDELEDGEIQDEEDEEEEEDARPSRFSLNNPFGKGKKQTASGKRKPAAEEYDEDEEEGQPQGRRQSHCERIVNVRQIEECREIIKYLLRGESVLLNLENIDPKDCGRVVDLLSGAAFALQGRMLKVAHLSYLLAPENVEVIEEDVYAASRMRYR